MNSEEALHKLIEILQHAHAGETAAMNAYEGHWRSLKDPAEAALIRRIQQDEIDHKALVATMLSRLGSAPNHRRDKVFFGIGKTISALCRLGGWYIPLWPTTLEGAEMGPLPCQVVFDGDCHVCDSSVAFLERLDRGKSLVFVASGSTAGLELQKRFGVDVMAQGTMLVIRGDRHFVRSDAALEAAAQLGGVWIFVLPLRLIPRFIRDGIYGYFASRRYCWFGRKSQCTLSPGATEPVAPPLS